MELLKLMTKADILHIPYRATTAAMADLMGGRIDMILIGQSSAKSQVDAGKLRALGIASTERSSLMPALPTIAESGVPGYEASSMFAIMAPATTPPAIIARLAREVKTASTHEKFIAALAPQGMEIIATAPAEMDKAMRETSKKWGEVITATGTTINQ
jgi:tripartite-type tricarboxylate transporter receptor subunit TctC